MHKQVFVHTKEKPTKEVLAAALAPFGSEALGYGARWDWWALGGRFAGTLIPHDVSDTVTGGLDTVIDGQDAADFEKGVGGRLSEAGWSVTALGNEVGPGVDALQLRNLKALHGGWPLAVVIDSYWHECDVNPVEPLFELCKAMGLKTRTSAAEHDFSEERAAVARWDHKVEKLLGDLPADHWISVVDCHN